MNRNWNEVKLEVRLFNDRNVKLKFIIQASIDNVLKIFTTLIAILKQVDY